MGRLLQRTKRRSEAKLRRNQAYPIRFRERTPRFIDGRFLSLVTGFENRGGRVWEK
jgi:hypothetical protein